MKLRISNLLLGVLVAVGAVLSLNATFGYVRSFRSATGSMEPTIPTPCRLLIVRAQSAERGELIAFRYPMNPDVTYLKRVVGMPGDEVEIRDKMLVVNGRAAVEPYVVHKDPRSFPNDPLQIEPFRSRDNLPPFRVPPDHYFVLGDNREFSSDSRYWGPLPRANVTGRVVCAFTLSRGFWRPR